MRNLIDSFEATSKFSKEWKDTDLTFMMFTSSFSYLSNVKDTAKLLKSKKLARIFEKTIQEFSNNFNTVGGPVSILKISKDNSISFIKNDFSDNPLGEKDAHLVSIKDSAIWNRQLREFNQ